MKALKIVPRATATGSLLRFTWVFKVKKLEQPIRFRARLCALGFMESDVGETFAPTAKTSSVTLLLVLGMLYDLEMDVYDLFGAAPPGIDLQDANTVMELYKSLYGLKEAPRHFSGLLTEKILDFGLKRSVYDDCIYYSIEQKSLYQLTR